MIFLFFYLKTFSNRRFFVFVFHNINNKYWLITNPLFSMLNWFSFAFYHTRNYYKSRLEQLEKFRDTRRCFKFCNADTLNSSNCFFFTLSFVLTVFVSVCLLIFICLLVWCYTVNEPIF